MIAKPLRDRAKKIHPVAVRLDEDTKTALDELARQDERSTSDYIRKVLRHHVAREFERKSRK